MSPETSINTEDISLEDIAPGEILLQLFKDYSRLSSLVLGKAIQRDSDGVKRIDTKLCDTSDIHTSRILATEPYSLMDNKTVQTIIISHQLGLTEAQTLSYLQLAVLHLSKLKEEDKQELTDEWAIEIAAEAGRESEVEHDITPSEVDRNMAQWEVNDQYRCTEAVIPGLQHYYYWQREARSPEPTRMIMDWAMQPTQAKSDNANQPERAEGSAEGTNAAAAWRRAERRRKRQEAGNVEEFEEVLSSVDKNLSLAVRLMAQYSEPMEGEAEN